MKTFFYLMLLVLLTPHSLVAVTQSKEFIYVGWDNDPYYYRDSAHGIQGVFHEIMTEICRMQNYQCHFKILPFRDSMEILKRGDADGGGPFVFTYPRATILNFGDKMFSTNYAFFALPKTAAKISAYDDLSGKTIGVLALSVSKVSLESVNEFVNGKIKIVTEKNISSIMRKIENQNYPLGYLSREAGLTWISKRQSSIREIPNLGENLDYRLAFSKKKFPDEEYQKIKLSFQELRQSGFLEKVAKKYNLRLAE